MLRKPDLPIEPLARVGGRAGGNGNEAVHTLVMGRSFGCGREVGPSADSTASDPRMASILRNLQSHVPPLQCAFHLACPL